MIYKCIYCGRFVTGYIPKGGDGSIDVLRTHKDLLGRRCEGSRVEASPWPDPKPFPKRRAASVTAEERAAIEKGQA